MKGHKTDLLFGITSKIPRSRKHYFLADFDEIKEETLMDRVGRILFNKHTFGVVYLIETGKGFHLANFTEKLKLAIYIKLLKEMKSDKEFIRWVKKVGYGVLRLSRRSGHKTVPLLRSILLPPYKYRHRENVFIKNFYFTALKLEERDKNIRRVVVYEKKDE